MISPINFTRTNYFSTSRTKNSVAFTPNQHQLSFGFNKDVFIKKGIIKADSEINDYFDNFCDNSFSIEVSESLKPLLKDGSVAFSSSIYSNPKNPKSSTGVILNPQDSVAKNISKLISSVAKGEGVGINFSEFLNPIDEIKAINSYFKYKEGEVKRPPAGIGLLNINHPKILDFIGMKDDIDHSQWCFDLSVVIDDDFMKKLEFNEDYELSDGTILPAKTIFEKLISSMPKKGEPGIIFSNEKHYITDPCAAQNLTNQGDLTIGYLNLAQFYDTEKGSIDFEKMKYCANTLASALKELDTGASIGFLGYQELLESLNIEYGSIEAIDVLKQCLKTFDSVDIQIALSPSATMSRFLEATPSIEPRNPLYVDDYKEIDTLAATQEYLKTKGEGQISKTIILDEKTQKNTGDLVKYAYLKGLSGISVFKPE